MKIGLKKGLAAAMVAALSVTGIASAASAHTNSTNGKYTITGDETFWKISRQMHIPLNELLAVNAGVNPFNLYPGVVVNLPKASKPMVKAANAIRTASGQSVEYKRVLSVKATAYTAAAQENGWGPVDYFGKPLKLGTIAVDPSVIPLGSKVYITGYSFSGLPQGGMIAKATDKGSAINANRIDIFIPTSPAQASKFGVQNVKVYILK